MVIHLPMINTTLWPIVYVLRIETGTEGDANELCSTYPSECTTSMNGPGYRTFNRAEIRHFGDHLAYKPSALRSLAPLAGGLRRFWNTKRCRRFWSFQITRICFSCMSSTWDSTVVNTCTHAQLHTAIWHVKNVVQRKLVYSQQQVLKQGNFNGPITVQLPRKHYAWNSYTPRKQTTTVTHRISPTGSFSFWI